MKKLLLFASGLAAALNVNAQYAKHTFSDAAASLKRTPFPLVERSGYVPNPISAARTTATCFYTETFASGAGVVMPTGWSAGSTVPAAGPTWRWTNTNLGGTYNIGTLASPTASDGWMGYNSDSIGDIGGGTGIKPSGWLQSPVINCATHTTVRLSFYEKFRRFQDSMSVWVGTDPGFAAGTYGVYPVTVNNTTPVNSSLPNPTKVALNISGAAAGQAAVYLRFVYYCYQDGGGYNWLIDDICMSELDPDDVGVAKSFMFGPDPGYDYDGSIFNTPLKYVDSVYPVTLLSNYGYNSPATTSLTAQIFRGTTSVYSVTTTYTGLPVNAMDSVVQWFPPYLPDAMGDYVCAISSSITSTDADMANNVDTVRFSVTDTTYMVNQGTIAGGYYLYRPTGSSGPAIAFMQGTRFDIPTGSVDDTVSGFGVVFNSQSVPTGAGKVSVQLYKHTAGATGWDYVGTSIAKSLTAGDISTSTTTVWSDFRSDPLNSGGDIILQAGFNYAALVQINNVTTNLVISSTNPPNATGYCGYFGQSDSSTNTGATGEFAPTTNATGIASVPLVRLYTGKPPRVNAVPVLNANGAIVGKGFPNPANNTFTVPVTTADNAVVTVSLTNVLGQELKSQSVTTVGGQASPVTFATADLTNGVYFYNVKVNGESVTGRIVVSH